ITDNSCGNGTNVPSLWPALPGDPCGVPDQANVRIDAGTVTPLGMAGGASTSGCNLDVISGLADSELAYAETLLDSFEVSCGITTSEGISDALALVPGINAIYALFEGIINDAVKDAAVADFIAELPDMNLVGMLFGFGAAAELPPDAFEGCDQILEQTVLS